MNTPTGSGGANALIGLLSGTPMALIWIDSDLDGRVQQDAHERLASLDGATVTRATRLDSTGSAPAFLVGLPGDGIDQLVQIIQLALSLGQGSIIFRRNEQCRLIDTRSGWHTDDRYLCSGPGFGIIFTTNPDRVRYQFDVGGEPINVHVGCPDRTDRVEPLKTIWEAKNDVAL